MSRPGDPEGWRVAVLSRSVSPTHGVGGLERHVADLVRHLAGRGVQVTLITREAPGAAPPVSPGNPRVAVAHVPYLTFPFAGRRGTTVIDRSTAYPLFGYRAGRLAAALAATGQLDLVYGHGASTLGYALAHRRNPSGTPPLVFNPHGLEEFGGLDGAFAGQRAKQLGYAPLRWAVRVCARAADRVIATDRAIETAITHHLGVGPDRMRLAPNAVDLPACDRLAGPSDGAALRARHAIAPDEFVLVSVGRIERNKGFHLLPEALSTLADRPWRWVLVGDGSYRREITRRLAAHGLAGRTILAGRVDDATLHAWYEAASLFVHPSLYEGSSIVTLEAMAHRRAVVATTAGGLPDKVRPGRTGWLVPPGEPAALGRALGEALEARGRLPEMGLAGRALVDAEFSWAAVTERLVAVFAELLDEARPS